MIRPASFPDIPALRDILKDALSRSRYADIAPMNGAALNAGLIQAMGLQDATPKPNACLILVSEGKARLDGVLIAVAQPLYQVLDLLMVTDMIFYTRPGSSAGPALMRAMHDWAAGADMPVVVRQGFADAVIDPERAAPLAERMGMRRAGIVYEKELHP